MSSILESVSGTRNNTEEPPSSTPKKEEAQEDVLEEKQTVSSFQAKEDINTSEDKHPSGDSEEKGTPEEDKALAASSSPLTIVASSAIRTKWTSKTEFILSCISMSVGLGNLWRFPVKAFQNGGGAFLIPYFIILFLIGIPIYFLEICLGQFTSGIPPRHWNSVPFFKGISYGSAVASLCVITYCAAIISLSLFYMIMSFQKNLPWDTCENLWAGANNCVGSLLRKRTDSPTETLDNSSSLPLLYFKNHVVREQESINEGIGGPDWRLTLCLLLTWAFIYLSIIKGIKSSGKVAYVTAIFPYVVLFVLLVTGCTLEGAKNGVYYYIRPEWEKLADISVWYQAMNQCFFSLGTGTGVIIIYSSYNNFRSNIYSSLLIVALTDTFTSVLCGFITFAILGNLAHKLNVEVKHVVLSGAGLTFISYPEALANLGWAKQLLSVMFFLMLFFLGAGSATADTISVSTVISNHFPRIKPWAISGAVCLFSFAVGLVYMTPGGQWILDLVDWYGGGFVIVLMVTLEVIGVIWCYGMYNFINDIEFMLERKLKFVWYWKICWVIIPILLIITLIYSLVIDSIAIHQFGTLELDYPSIAIVCGWLIVVASLICVFVGAFVAVHKSSGNGYGLWNRLKTSFKPNEDWGPLQHNYTYYEDWLVYKANSDQRTFWQRLKATSGL